jgi:hypothetical protein
LRQCDLYGVDHRTPMNQTPLMAAACAGNAPLVAALLERGADLEAVDHLGRNALHWALQRAFTDPDFATASLPLVYELIAPSCIDLQAGERLVRIDRRLTEYLLLQTLWTLFRFSFPTHRTERAGFNTAMILEAWNALPAAVLRPERKQRAHLSGVLARNEVDRDYAWNRRLFVRVATGWYQFNPALRVRGRVPDQWLPILTALNLPLVHELQSNVGWHSTRALGKQLSDAELPVPIMWARAWEKQQAMLRATDLQRTQMAKPAERVQPKLSAPTAPAAPTAPDASDANPPSPPWGTRAARALEKQKLAARIAESREREAAKKEQS